MSESYVQVAPEGTGKKIDNELVETTAGSLIYRQRVALAGDAAASVQNTAELLERILIELRVHTVLLAQLAGSRDNPYSLRSDIASEL